MKNLEQEIYQYLLERNWHKLLPGDLAKSISIESSELLEIFQWSNPTLEETRNNPEKLEEIKKELADVMIYCIEMSTLLGLDTEQIIKDKLEKVKQKYPAELMRKNAEKITPGTDSEYWEIKKIHRQSQ
jgi:dCTP diphosphatase